MEEHDNKNGHSKVAEILDDLLPNITLGPAGPAISRLIAGGLDIPASWLDQ